MESANAKAEALRRQIQATEAKLVRLKRQLAQVEGAAISQRITGLSLQDPATQQDKRWPLLPEEYKRYGRQMIVPSVGIQGM